jgi:hypothetical protein
MIVDGLLKHLQSDSIANDDKDMSSRLSKPEVHELFGHLGADYVVRRLSVDLSKNGDIAVAPICKISNLSLPNSKDGLPEQVVRISMEACRSRRRHARGKTLLISRASSTISYGLFGDFGSYLA